MDFNSAKVRVGMLICVVVLTFLAFTTRLMHWQVVEGEQYKKISQRNTTREQVIDASRGEIVDRNGIPLVVNEVSFDVIIDKAILPEGKENNIILQLINIFRKQKEKWNDVLPITTQKPYKFKQNSEKEVSQLIESLSLGEYVDADLVMFHLKEKYDLQKYSEKTARDIAGIRYQMSMQNYSLSNPYIFASDIKPKTSTIIMEDSMKLAGAYINETTKRKYPDGEVAPHIIGQIGPIWKEEKDLYTKDKGYNLNDMVGKSGIEKVMESKLKGTDGTRQIVLDSKGNVVDIWENKPAVPGNTVVLTIDSQMQKVATQALKKEIEHLNKKPPTKGREANAGSVSVIDVKTGEVLVAANYPTYDLTNYNKNYNELMQDKANPIWNRALLGQYAPGSTFKPVVGLGALTQGIVGKNTTVYCGHVYTYFSDYQPNCVGFHRDISVVRAIQESCNIYFYDVGRRLGLELINKYSEELGLGVPTGIELPENIGQLTTVKDFPNRHPNEVWTNGNILQASIGQLDTKFTPIQLASYTATMANKGKRMDLNLVKSVESYNFDKTILKTKPTILSNSTIPKENFDIIKEGMINVSKIGTASMFLGNYPIPVASKTGSPQISSNLSNAVFIAYAPADDPEIAISVVIEKGCHGLYGVPVAKEILDYYFQEGDSTQNISQKGIILE